MRIYINGVYNTPNRLHPTQQEIRMHHRIKDAILESTWYNFMYREVVIWCDIKECEMVFRLSIGDNHSEFIIKDLYKFTRQTEVSEPQDNYPLKDELKMLFKRSVKEMLGL